MNVRIVSSASSRVTAGLLRQQRDFLAKGADAADRQHDGDGEDRQPLLAGGVHVVDELVASLAAVLDAVGLFGRERRVDEKSKRAAGFEHRAVARVLRQERPLSVAARLQADAGTPEVGKQPDFHVRILGQS